MSEQSTETSEAQAEAATTTEQKPDTGGRGVDYPADTPVADMTPVQQTAYWREQAQKHEKQWKAVKNTDLAEARRLLRTAEKERDALKQSQMTEQEKAVDEAKAQARTEAIRESAPRLVSAEFRAVSAGRLTPEQVAELIEDLDMTKYLTDSGEVDIERVTKKVDALAPKGDGKPVFPDMGQGRRTAATTPLDPRAADLAQIEADLAAGRRR